MSEILVVGSLAYDSIESPEGKVGKVLGGSANYFSLTACHFTKIYMIGVVGEDYKKEDMDRLSSRNIDIRGVQVVQGKTFHWEGKYEDNMNEAITLNTELNVFENFKPTIPQNLKKSPFVFLANMDPHLQMEVMDQVQSPLVVASDTMNIWITSKKQELLKVLKKVDLLVINEGESILLTGQKNAISASEEILTMGPKAVVIKRGEYGFIVRMGDRFFALPAFPIPRVLDPTGAGDSFAGGLFGYLANKNKILDFENLKQACLWGTIASSFTVEGFGVTGLVRANMEDFQNRMDQYLKFVQL